MGRKRHTPEQIITALREAEVGLARGKSVKLISRELGITEQTYYRWRREYGGMKVSPSRLLLEPVLPIRIALRVGLVGCIFHGFIFLKLVDVFAWRAPAFSRPGASSFLGRFFRVVAGRRSKELERGR